MAGRGKLARTAARAEEEGIKKKRTLSGPISVRRSGPILKLERAMGFEPTTPTLARLCSTPELHPHPSFRNRVALIECPCLGYPVGTHSPASSARSVSVAAGTRRCMPCRAGIGKRQGQKKLAGLPKSAPEAGFGPGISGAAPAASPSDVGTGARIHVRRARSPEARAESAAGSGRAGVSLCPGALHASAWAPGGHGDDRPRAISRREGEGARSAPAYPGSGPRAPVAFGWICY